MISLQQMTSGVFIKKTPISLQLLSELQFISDYPDKTAGTLAKTRGLPLEVTKKSMALHDYKSCFNGNVIASLENRADFLQTENPIENIPDFLTVSNIVYLNLTQKS